MLFRSTAAQSVSVPTLIFSGANDCVAPPAQQQDIMYDSTTASYKTQINITGGGHCYFANNNFNCSFGEATCSPSPTITRSEQQLATEDFLKIWLAYYLKNDCSKAQEFQDSLALSSRITYRQSQPIVCTSSGMENLTANTFSVYPNPTSDNLIINTKSIGTNYQLTDALGRIILQGKITSENTTVALYDLANGIYFLRLENTKKQSIKVVKE